MPQNNYNQSQKEFRQFRDKLYQSFNYRRDTVMDLVDAIAANTRARTPVELSLSSLFSRGYSALYKGIQELSRTTYTDSTKVSKSQLTRIEAQTLAIAELIPTPKRKKFYLWAIDVTPLPRPYAKTLKEKTFIYQPNTVQGNKPINIGHSYSVLTALPEKEETGNTSWAIPLTVERVKSDQTGKQVGSQQLKQILSQSNLPWSNHLSVVVVDSDYSAKTFLAEQEQHTNLVVVTRVRSNRVFYTCPEPKAKLSVGHPQWYGTKFDLKDKTTWHEPNQVVKENFATSRGRLLNVTIRSWSEMLMRGSRNCSMHRQPFSLIQIQVSTTEGMRIWKPMWLIMIGQHRNELSVSQAYQAYRQRYDIEHLLRFSKQKLLLNAITTPEVKHEENWVQLSFLAYVQLWAARKLALTLPRPWERYLPKKSAGFLAPSQVQRDLNRIITEIGTPANSPKRRGYSQGRTQGMVQTKRTRHEVLKKGKKEKKPEPTSPIAV